MMARDRIVTRKKTESFYDRIADVHNFALKLNGYRRSVAKYLRSLDLEVGPYRVEVVEPLETGTPGDTVRCTSGMQTEPRVTP
jgi:hypothetical protein